MEGYKVVRYLGETTKGLTQNKLYVVEDNPDWVEAEVYDLFGAVTVWNDEGRLHEIFRDEHAFVENVDWRTIIPKNRVLDVV